ncbi:MAG: DUF4097 family beta strand repeat-containing protein [Thermoanaerobaculia bacterium]|nr:DUF4097 family beta strand repeat-containing protein [Thermoanaerobaculia bacterium]
MKTHRTLFALLLLATLAAAPAAADRQVDRTVPADPEATVEIELVSGDLTIEAWDRNEVRITGTLGDDVEELVVDGSGRRITIEVEFPDRGGRSWRRDIDADLEIFVPAGARVEAESVSASISATGVRGQVELSSVSGGLKVSGGGAALDLETVSGSIMVRRSPVPVAAESVSGSIDLDGVRGRVEASSVSGRIEVRADQADRIELEAVSGSIEFDGSLSGRARMDVSSHSGNVDVTLAGEVSADFDVSSYSGSIDNEFGPAPRRESRWVPSKSVEFTVGAGDAQVTIETFSGSVRLRRR